METWYTVERESGGTAKNCGGRWAADSAEEIAEGAASLTDEPVVVVEHTRRVVATYRRTVNITVAREEGAGDE